jgi:ABC-type transporter Mla MlaB component
MTLEDHELSSGAGDQSVAGSPRRRHDAVASARFELAASEVSAHEPAVATRGYGDGQLAVCLAGEFDRAAVERLRGTLRDLGRLASTELVIDLSGLASCNSALARFLAELRVKHLIAGTRVELHAVPAELATAMGHSPAQQFSVHDHPAPSSSPIPAPGSAPASEPLRPAEPTSAAMTRRR